MLRIEGPVHLILLCERNVTAAAGWHVASADKAEPNIPFLPRKKKEVAFCKEKEIRCLALLIYYSKGHFKAGSYIFLG